MKNRRSKRIRNASVLFVVSLTTVLLWTACSGPSSQQRSTADETHTQSSEPARANAPTGPFDVARRWADELPIDDAPLGVREMVQSWRGARVERVYAHDDHYRAVIVERSTTEKIPAVLLTIERDDARAWSVTASQTANSTHLWPEL